MDIQESNGQLFHETRLIANFVPIVERLYTAPGSDMQPPVLSLHIQCGARSAAQHLIVPFEDLDRLDFPQQVPGCIYYSKSGRTWAINFIRQQVGQLLEANHQCGTYFQSSGWHPKGEEIVYIIGNEIVTTTGIEEPSGDYIAPGVSALSLVRDHSLSATQAAEGLIKALPGYREYAIPTFAYTLYAANHSLWGEVGLPTACVLNLQGTQNAGKTQLAKRFCALYQERNSGNFADFYDAAGTLAAIRSQLSCARDRVVVCDDICQSTNPSAMAKRRNLAADLIRVVANETPHVKISGGKGIYSDCTAGLVITGELPLAVASDITRTITLKISEPLRGRPNTDRILAASALAEYLCWLCRHRDHELSQLRSDFRRYQENSKPGRLEISIFQLNWVFESFLRFALNANAINAQVQAALSNRSDYIFKNVYSSQMRDIHRVQMVQSVPWAQLAVEGAQQKAFPFHSRPGCICVTPGDFANYCRDRLGDSALQIETIIAGLRTEHLLAMDRSGKSTKKINGIRHLCILTQKA